MKASLRKMRCFKKRKMKKITIIIAFLLLNINLFAQITEGVVKYQTTFNWLKRIAPLNFISKQAKEKMEYQWANDAEWKQFNLLYFNEKESKYIESEEKAQDEGGYSWKKQKFEIHKYFDIKKQKDIIEIFGKVHIIEDSLPNLGWKIKNDIREIAGHICMNASREDTTKLQKIEAWFALDIPIPAGPERNFGLPGIILQLNVNDGALLVEAISITTQKLTTELNFPPKIKGKKITEATYTDIINKWMKEKIKAEEYPYWGIPY
jgi:GLPGLI family protein